MWISLSSETLLSIPMFLLAGNIMTRGAIAQRLIRIMVLLTDPLPGGMGVATVLSCAVFAAISGSSPVTLLAVGTVMYPALIEQGYDKRFAIGSITSGGTLGIIIPPSLPLIVYGLATEQSISDLFIAGIVPGLVLTAAFAIYSFVVNRRLPSRRFDSKALAHALREGLWSMMLPVILLGGIYSGLLTVTEAAAVGLLYAIFIEIAVHRELRLADFKATAISTARMLGILFPIIAVALSLKSLLTIMRVPHELTEWITDLTTNKIAFLLVVNMLLLVVGLFFDVMSAILILAPLLVMPAAAFGIDPIHFGIMMVINLEIGFLTPPIGLNLFVAVTAFRESFRTVCFAVLPFVAITFGVLMLVAFVPQLSLFLLR
jgi:C4-dicarboxylate transporter DctM subunit